LRLAILLLLTACGRYAFDPREDAAPADMAVSMIETGCSDGSREGFDIVQFPTIAGCNATWSGTPSMRDPAIGAPCGNDLGACATPADACAPGWHICADNGDPVELSSRVSAADCYNVPGAFVAAIQHCADCINTCTMPSDCQYATSYGCSPTAGTCTEPVCCGITCDTGNLCLLGVFGSPGSHDAVTDHPCGALDSTGQSGVLCCQ
jgi:hypothetical protein